MECKQAFLAYDTLCRITADFSELSAAKVLEQCEEEAHELERTLSMFDPESELSCLCQEAIPGREVRISDTLRSFLEENLVVCQLSGGAFDPTVGPLVKMWDFLAETPKIPSDEAVQNALKKVGYQHILLDREAGTVSFDIPGVGLDPGAAGKGFALGLAVRRLRKAGVERAVLDYGGNLFVIGGRKDDAGEEYPWRVAIRDPDDVDAVLGVLELSDAGIATSSWYEHSFWKDGKVYHHLLDPRTGYPMPLTLKSVSIVSSRPVYTDLLSTAFFILGEKEGKKLVEHLRKESGEQIEYVVVREDSSIAVSDGVVFTAKKVMR